MSKKIEGLPYENAVSLLKSQNLPGLYDVELGNVQALKSFSTVELHAVLYPFDRRVNASHLTFLPFEEYVRDISSSQHSLYASINTVANSVFGLALGAVIAAVFGVFNPSDLISVQSVVAVFGAYFIGKDLWNDVERALIGLTKKWRLRFVRDYYIYRLERDTTLANYSAYAKETRYGKALLLPGKMDFIQQSNSQTLRLCFQRRDLAEADAERAHLFSIHVDPLAAEAFEAGGYLLGVKLALSKRFLGVRHSFELFQSLRNLEPGCLGSGGRWLESTLFYRRTYCVGNLKLFAAAGYVTPSAMVSAGNVNE